MTLALATIMTSLAGVAAAQGAANPEIGFATLENTRPAAPERRILDAAIRWLVAVTEWSLRRF